MNNATLGSAGVSLLLCVVIGSSLCGQRRGEQIAGTWAFADADALYVVVILGSGGGHAPRVFLQTDESEGKGDTPAWERTTRAGTVIFRNRELRGRVWSTRVGADGQKQEVPVVAVETGDLSPDTVPRERRIGRECTGFLRACFGEFVSDNGHLRDLLIRICGQLGRWGKAETVRALWRTERPREARFLERVLQHLIQY